MAKKVYISAGHGGIQPGAVGNGLIEKGLTLKIALAAYHELKKYDVEVRMCRMTDIDVGLDERVRQANTWGADVFIDIHTNAGGGTGLETFRAPEANSSATIRFHEVIHRHLKGVFSDFRDRGMKQYPFYVCRHTTMPAILTENGFIDRKEDAEFLKNNSNLIKIGVAHAQAIVEYLDLKLKQEEVADKVVAKPIPDLSKSILKREGNHTYYIVEGERKTGFHKIDEYWRYFHEDTGRQAFGFTPVNGQWYYFRTYTGTMATGWQHINGQDYYFRESGTRVSGWQWVADINGENKGWHYFGQEGQLIGRSGSIDTDYTPF